jgi:photosystem II stability/assembly factor-like uncharacterized protein
MHLQRRSMLTTAITIAMALGLIGSPGSIALARTPDMQPNPVASGFQPSSLAFFDVDHGIVAGTIVCPTCTKHRTSAISTTADGGYTWSSPTTFGPASAGGVTVVPGGLDAWALVGKRLEHSGDGGTTWSIIPDAGVSGPSFATSADGWAIRRTSVSSRVVMSSDGGATWAAAPQPCHHAALDALFVDRTSVADGWVVCGGGAAAGSRLQVVWKTTDGGTTWARESHGLAPEPIGYRFLDDGRGWRWHAAFADLFHTTDGGKTWHDIGSVGNVFVADLWFVSDANGFAITRRGNGSSELLSSTDAGASWSGVARFPTN